MYAAKLQSGESTSATLVRETEENIEMLPSLSLFPHWSDSFPLLLPKYNPVDRETLFGEFQPLMRRLIRQYGSNPELREDLRGEIYCRFCALLDAYDPGRGVPLKPYLVRQLTASAYTFARHQWRRQQREVNLEIEAADAHHAAHALDPSQQWDDTLLIQRIQSGLGDALCLLSLRQRQVVIWRYYEARSFEEIAERLDIKVATARSILRHALLNLRRHLIQSNLNYE